MDCLGLSGNCLDIAGSHNRAALRKPTAAAGTSATEHAPQREHDLMAASACDFCACPDVLAGCQQRRNIVASASALDRPTDLEDLVVAQFHVGVHSVNRVQIDIETRLQALENIFDQMDCALNAADN